MARETTSSDDLVHAGVGTGLALVQLSALIPGLLPALAIAGLIGAVVLLPLVVLALAGALLLAPPTGVWLLIRRARS